MADQEEEEEDIPAENTTEVREEPQAVQKTSSPKAGAGDSSSTEAHNKEVGTSASANHLFSDISSEYDTCRHKRRKKKRKKKQSKVDWPAIPVEYNPCPHLHFKTSTLNRYALSRDEYTSLLATPKGYRWECHTEEVRYTRKGKIKKTRKLKRAQKETEKDDKMYIGHFLGEIWKSLPPKMVEQLQQLLVEEFGMSEEEADEFVQQQKDYSQTNEEKKMKRRQYHPPETKIGVRNKWLKDFSRIFADKVTDYVVTMLCCRRTPRVQKLAEALLNHFCDITGEKTTLKAPKTKIQRILVFIADRVAVWFDSLMKESEDKKTKDESIEAKISISEKSSPKSEVEKGEEEEIGEEQKTPKSKSLSEPTSKLSSKEGSIGESELPLEPPEPSSKQPSREGSEETSKASSKEQLEEGDEGEEPATEEGSEAEEEEAISFEEEGALEEVEEGEVEEEEEEITEMEEGEFEEVKSEGEEEEEEEEEFLDEEEGVEEEAMEFEEEETEEEGEISSEESEESEEIITVPPPLPPLPIRDRELVYQLTKDGSKYNVRQLSSVTVAEKVAEARKREIPIRGGTLQNKPLTESPLNLISMKQWADWAAQAADVSQQWISWVDKTVAAAEEKSRMHKGKVIAEDGRPMKLTKEEWKQWQVETKRAADEITKKKYEWKRNIETWKIKTEKAVEKIGPEIETNLTNLTSEGEKPENQGPEITEEAGAPSSDAPLPEGEEAAAEEEGVEESPE